MFVWDNFKRENFHYDNASDTTAPLFAEGPNAFDFTGNAGAIYQREKISFGLLLKNFIPAKLAQDSNSKVNTLTPTLNVTGKYWIEKIKGDVGIFASYSFDAPSGKEFNLGVGIESYRIHKSLSLRAGINRNEFTTGVGIQIPVWRGFGRNR